MSNAFKCDRCGGLFEGNPALDYRVHQTSMGAKLPQIIKRTGDIEVCPDCGEVLAQALSDVLDYEPEGDSE